VDYYKNFQNQPGTTLRHELCISLIYIHSMDFGINNSITVFIDDTIRQDWEVQTHRVGV
jgi:hypothetical protein